MAQKYRVFAGCRNCGRGYWSKAKNSKTSPNQCKYCGSTDMSKPLDVETA